MHYYKRNIGDYHKKAGRLSMLQHGAYTLLIDSCYDREKFPTKEEAIDWAWASSLDEIEAVEFVLKKFFTLEDGVYIQKQIKENVCKYQANSLTNKRIAVDRERKRRETNGKEKGTDCDDKSTVRAQSVNEPPPNHKPLTNNHKPLTNNLSKKQAKKTDVDYSVFDVSESQCEEIKRIRKINNKGKAGATLTQRVANSIAEELKKALSAGFDVESCLTEWEDRGWRTFKSEWMANSKSNSNGTEPQEFSDITLQNINTLKNWTPPNEQ